MVSENAQEKVVNIVSESKKIEELERELSQMKKEIAEFKEEFSRTNQQFEQRLNELKGKKGSEDMKQQVEEALVKIEKMNGAWSLTGSIWQGFILLLDLVWISSGLVLLLLHRDIEQLLGLSVPLEETAVYIYIPVALLLILLTAGAMIKPNAKKDYAKISEIVDISTRETVSERMVKPFTERLEFEVSENRSRYGWYFMIALGAVILPIGEFNSILILMKPILLMQLLLCFHILWIRPNWLKKQAKIIFKNRLLAMVEE